MTGSQPEKEEMMLNVSKLLAETVSAVAQLTAAKMEIPEEAHTMREIMERCVAAETERDRLRLAIWPGLPKWEPTPDFPQQNFYEAVAETNVGGGVLKDLIEDVFGQNGIEALKAAREHGKSGTLATDFISGWLSTEQALSVANKSDQQPVDAP